jgi:hypothetical protein
METLVLELGTMTHKETNPSSKSLNKHASRACNNFMWSSTWLSPTGFHLPSAEAVEDETTWFLFGMEIHQTRMYTYIPRCNCFQMTFVLTTFDHSSNVLTRLKRSTRSDISSELDYKRVLLYKNYAKVSNFGIPVSCLHAGIKWFILRNVVAIPMICRQNMTFMKLWPTKIS